MLIGIPREPQEEQTLVGATPDTVAKLLKLGYEVCVEAGAGARASYHDAQYQEAGATIVDAATAWGADIVVCLDNPPAEQLAAMKPGATLISRLDPRSNEEGIKAFAEAGITALAMDMVPRISRAQSLDVRSSLDNIGGNRAVIEAASAYARLLGGQVTAAGKTAPAKVYVIGVGVAGLAALGAAGSMGAEVYATDVRAEVAEQVESLGATFVEIPVKQQSKDGYARALTDEEQAQVIATYTAQCAKSDIVITTARVPGRPAPLLVTEEAVAGMAPGSVVVDMGASPLGGNCALSKPDEIVQTENGVTIIGYMNLPARLPGQASQLYGQNIVNFLKLCTPAKDGVPTWDQEDEVVRGVTVTLDGQITWPPPPVQVSAAKTEPAKGDGAKAKDAAPAAAGAAGATAAAADKPAEKAAAKPAAQAAEDKPAKKKSGLWWKVVLAVAVVALVLLSPAAMAQHYVVFALACVVGFYVITNVEHSLHTPLMSETNAISGIIIVGAVLLVGSENPVVAGLSFVAMAIAAINIFGGFLVTNRMLKMFQRSSDDE